LPENQTGSKTIRWHAGNRSAASRASRARVIFVPVCAAFLYRFHVVEQTPLAAFGEEYRAYSATTKRLIPGIYQAAMKEFRL